MSSHALSTPHQEEENSKSFSFSDSDESSNSNYERLRVNMETKRSNEETNEAAAKDEIHLDASDDSSDDWIPLKDHDHHNPSKPGTKASSMYKSSFSSPNKLHFGTASQSAASSSSTPKISTPSTSKQRRENMEDIETKLQDRVKLREELIRHPLQSFGRIFGSHFLQHLWMQHWQIRVGEFGNFLESLSISYHFSIKYNNFLLNF